jgi:hypothetical protein
LDKEQEEKVDQWNLKIIMKPQAWHRTPKRRYREAAYKATWIELKFLE